MGVVGSLIGRVSAQGTVFTLHDGTSLTWVYPFHIDSAGKSIERPDGNVFRIVNLTGSMLSTSGTESELMWLIVCRRIAQHPMDVGATLTIRGNNVMMPQTKRAVQCGRLGGMMDAAGSLHLPAGKLRLSRSDCQSRLNDDGSTNNIAPSMLSQSPFLGCVAQSLQFVEPVCAEHSHRLRTDKMDGARAPP